MKTTYFFILFFLFISTANAQNGVLWGMTNWGGEDNAGAIINIKAGEDTIELVHNFRNDHPGSNPERLLLLASNGKFYGTTTKGGTYNRGVLFEYDAQTNSYTRLINFEKNTGTLPVTTLVEPIKGKLYGTTWLDGSLDSTFCSGVLFEYDISKKIYSKKVMFDDFVAKGDMPEGQLVDAGNGKLYGLTLSGGKNAMFPGSGEGVLFEYDLITGVFKKKLDADTSQGRISCLMRASDGKLYAVCAKQSPASDAIYEYDYANNALLKKVTLNPSIVGRYVTTELLDMKNGNLYALTYNGGKNNKGVIFEYNLSTAQIKKLYDLDSSYNRGFVSSFDGSLLKVAQDKFYGVSGGGKYKYGSIYEFDIPTNTFTEKFDLSNKQDGALPSYGMVMSPGGKLYGMTQEGGKGIGTANRSESGVIFEYDVASNVYTKKIDLNSAKDGACPFGDLVQASNGKFYGMTAKGGVHNLGVVFEYDPAQKLYKKLVDFDGPSSGSRPWGSLLLASNSKLYGLTSKGGIKDMGVLFEYDIATGKYTKKKDLDSKLSGSGPLGNLNEATNGKFYGLAMGGGANAKGTLFEYNPTTDSIQIKVSFDGKNKGASPEGSLLQASDGLLYGLTYAGGDFGYNAGYSGSGVIFSYDPVKQEYLKRHDFSLAIGQKPTGSLIENNGVLYGMTFDGGSTEAGVIFSYTLSTKKYNTMYHFRTPTGAQPFGSLVLASNGKIYGMCYSNKGPFGVQYPPPTDYGVVFEFDFTNSVYTKKADFLIKNGGYPWGSLVEGRAFVGIASANSKSKVQLYPNPCSDELNLRLPYAANWSIKVYNVAGQLLSQKLLRDQTSTTIDIRELSSGFYMLHLSNGKTLITEKVVKH